MEISGCHWWYFLVIIGNSLLSVDIGNYELNGITIIPIYHPSPISPKSYTGNIDIFNNLQEIINEKHLIKRK